MGWLWHTTISTLMSSVTLIIILYGILLYFRFSKWGVTFMQVKASGLTQFSLKASNYILNFFWVIKVCLNPGQVFQAFAFASSFLLQSWSGSRVARLPIWTIHWSIQYLCILAFHPGFQHNSDKKPRFTNLMSNTTSFCKHIGYTCRYVLGTNP